MLWIGHGVMSERGTSLRPVANASPSRGHHVWMLIWDVLSIMSKRI